MGRVKEEEEEAGYKLQSQNGSSSFPPKLGKSSVVVGLRILVQVKHRKPQPYLLTKQAIKPATSSLPPRKLNSDYQYSSFLKSCCLCNKNLNPLKDVYMYRGDQGYCSIECRNRQIILDDMKESEASIKKLMAASRHCYGNNNRDTLFSRNDHRHQPQSLLSYRKPSALIS